MPKIKLFIIMTTFFCVSCASLLQRNQSQQSNNSKRQNNSFLANIFGDTEDDDSYQEQNQQANLNLKQDSSRLPTSFQQQQRQSRFDVRSALSPLHLAHIDGNTWRTAANPLVVYGIISRILSQNYIISATDRKNLSVQTDWDKFFIDGRLFRNRMSVIVFPVSARQTEVVIKNTVEYYTGNVAKQEENTAWLPSPDLTNEVSKLVENTDRQTTYAYSQSFIRN